MATEPMDHAGRLLRLERTLSENGLDFLLVTHLPNIRYLSGFTGSAAALLVGDRGAVLFTDGRYRTQAKQEVKKARIVVGSKAPPVAAGEWLASQRLRGAQRSLGIEPESLTAGLHRRLETLVRGRLRMRLAPPLIERARMIKDAEEIRRIRAAVELGATLFPIACKEIRAGRREVEVAAAMEYGARREGAEAMSFPTILASGPRSAIVHGRASAARIPRRGFVVCDFGVILAGYCSDRTRTVHVGQPSREERAFYKAVREAQQAAIDCARAGVSASQVDEAARSVLRKWKLAKYFTHSTGHGLGLEIHEGPRLAAGQTQTLEPGMVVTIEPGAYIPGKRGVRIEDVVVITASGCEPLSATGKELIIL
jgi:Xaa-Pro aminopeptidase